jgi:hypothetical protein
LQSLILNQGYKLQLVSYSWQAGKLASWQAGKLASWQAVAQKCLVNPSIFKALSWGFDCG